MSDDKPVMTPRQMSFFSDWYVQIVWPSGRKERVDGFSSEAHALTHTLIQLGKALGLQTLAEGVEHHSQVRELQREGCDLAQGFLFARPLAADVVESFLRESPGLADASELGEQPLAPSPLTADPVP